MEHWVICYKFWKITQFWTVIEDTYIGSKAIISLNSFFSTFALKIPLNRLISDIKCLCFLHACMEYVVILYHELTTTILLLNVF